MNPLLAAPTPLMEDPSIMLRLDSFHYVYSVYNPGSYAAENEYEEMAQIYGGEKIGLKDMDSRGMFTFFTRFKLASALKTHQLSFYLEPVDSGGRIYLNGSLLTQVGDIREGYDGSVTLPRNVFIPEEMLLYDEVPNLLVYELYPAGREKVAFPSFRIGEYNKVESAVFWRGMAGIHFSQIAVGISIIVCIYLLFLFFNQGAKDFKLLWFAFLCLNFIFAYTNLSLTHNSSHMVFIEKIARVGLSYTVLFFTYFVMEYSRVLKKKRLLQVLLLVPALVNMILVIFQRDRPGVFSVFNFFMNFYILPLLGLSAVLLLIELVKGKNRQTLIILGGVAAIIITSLHDIHYSNINQNPYAWFVPMGFFCIVISLFLVIALEQAKTFKQSIKRATVLRKRNISFKHLLQQISDVSVSIDDSSRQLNDTIKDTSKIINHYSENNKNVMNKVFKQFEHVETVIARVQTRMDTAIERIPAAINKQTTMVEKITTTLSAIDSRLGASLASFDDSLASADQLYRLAEECNIINQQSRETILGIQANSSFLGDILSILEDLTEQTSLLSINVSIEATRAGLDGRGFSVIAGEIRKLADKSKENLTSSLHKIKEIVKLIEESSGHSQQIASSLEQIVTESGNSAGKVKLITGLIKKQKERSEDILQRTESLLSETHSIQQISHQEQKENQEIKEVLLELKEAFKEITDTLHNQETQEGELQNYLLRIKTVMDGTREHIGKLNLHTEKVESELKI